MTCVYKRREHLTRRYVHPQKLKFRLPINLEEDNNNLHTFHPLTVLSFLVNKVRFEFSGKQSALFHTLQSFVTDLLIGSHQFCVINKRRFSRYISNI